MKLLELENFFQSFGNVNRLRIIKLLSKKKMCVCELSFILGITQPSVSKHLKKLKQAKVIGSEQDGLWTNYFLEPKAVLLLSHINQWLTKDQQILSDHRKIRLANRSKLCCNTK